MTIEATIRKEIKTHKNAIKELKVELDKVLPNKQFKCYCGRRTQIRHISIISEMSYTEPYGCTGGDYWSFNEYYIVCPKCDEYIRAYDLQSYEKKNSMPDHYIDFLFVEKYYNHFKEHLDWYKRRGGLFDDDTITLEQLRAQKQKDDRRY